MVFAQNNNGLVKIMETLGIIKALAFNALWTTPLMIGLYYLVRKDYSIQSFLGVYVKIGLMGLSLVTMMLISESVPLNTDNIQYIYTNSLVVQIFASLCALAMCIVGLYIGINNYHCIDKYNN